MPGILQEKFQVDYPQQGNDDAHSGWVDDTSARVAKRGRGEVRGTKERHHGPSPETNDLFLNGLPPGMDIEDQEYTDQHPFKTVMGGESDVSRDWNTEAVAKGFKRLPMRATDDEYTKAHQDAFYDEMEVDGAIGFAERNNMLDRL